MRAVKRERYAVKERVKLDEMVKKAREHEKGQDSEIPFVQFIDIKAGKTKKDNEAIKGIV